MSTEHDPAFTALLAQLGGDWTPVAPNRAKRLEPGVELTLGMVVSEEGSGSVQMAVRPIVGWGWYVLPVVLPVGLVQGGLEMFPAFLIGFGAAIATRFGIGRFVLRARVNHHKARLAAAVGAAMAELGASERPA
ncbi:hypothetical protein LBMAG42_36140 [Deltaproteobacteria bacterium]|nr:hypothetical protein LBMAG42_36140 [Deltaproteobacteria bacterium]